MSDLLSGVFPDRLRLPDGPEIRIKTDFRLWLWVGKRLNGAGDVLTCAGLRELVDEVLDRVALDWTDEPAVSILPAIVAFYLCGEEVDRRTNRGGPNRGRSAPIYDLAFDSGAIYASFAQQYGIRLATIKEMHWWEFWTLLSYLGEDTPFRQRIRIRTMTARDVPRDKIGALKEAQEALRIPESETDAQIAESVAAYLKGFSRSGGSPETKRD